MLGCADAGSRMSQTLIKTIEKQCVLRFRGVDIEAKTGPETASGRDWAAGRRSDLGVILDPQIGPERGRNLILGSCQRLENYRLAV